MCSRHLGTSLLWFQWDYSTWLFKFFCGSTLTKPAPASYRKLKKAQINIWSYQPLRRLSPESLWNCILPDVRYKAHDRLQIVLPKDCQCNFHASSGGLEERTIYFCAYSSRRTARCMVIWEPGFMQGWIPRLVWSTLPFLLCLGFCALERLCLYWPGLWNT